MEYRAVHGSDILGGSVESGTEQTLDYYNKDTARFVETTVDVEFGELQEHFARMLPEGGRILDLGCGSGRDSLAFVNSGFVVAAIDGSEAMAKAASGLTGLPVAHALFDEHEPAGEYDGIWACSSLLHVPLSDLAPIIGKYTGHLKLGGVFYMSFRFGDFEGMRNGRWFTDIDEESFSELVDGIDGLRIDSLDVTSDVRPRRANKKWLNAWCIRE